MADLQVRRDELHETRIVESQPLASAGPHALLAVDAFGITANNVSYAVFGEAMRYWDFFPAADGWGRVPMWGFADVAESSVEGLEAGARVFGYLPPSNHLAVRPEGADARGFVDASPHRVHLPAVYNRYLRVDSDPFYDRRYEDQDMLMRPLFLTSFLLDDELGDGGLAGAGTVVMSSASAKTAIAAAYLLAKRDGVEVLGLTSARNVDFVEALGVYDRVVAYGRLDELELPRSVFVDVSGDPGVRAEIHRTLGELLAASISLGATHWREFGAGMADREAGGQLPGPAPRFFFAPDRMAKRNRDWGPAGLMRRAGEAARPFTAWVAEWLEIERGSGLEAAERAWRQLLDGDVPPSRAHVVSL